MRRQQTLDSVTHVIQNNVPGDFVEIGVWKGGTVMLMLYKLLQFGVTDRIVHLYDTFSGMTEPSLYNVDVFGRTATSRLQDLMCYSSYDEVYKNIKSVGYPMDNIKFHVGDIRHVKEIPDKIALLRLDNDWHELYAFELPLFEPKVSHGGIVTADDYGYWNGCRKAVDDYLKGRVTPIPIDMEGVYWYVSRNKRLVYTTACYDREFASLIEFFPIRDALVICDSKTQDLIPDTFTKLVIDHVPQNVQEASYQKLRIFELVKEEYDEYMYLDLDIIAHEDFDLSKSWITHPDKLHVVYETLWDVRHHSDMRAWNTNPKPFNAGQLTFTYTMKPHFKKILDMCVTRPGDSYYEQGFMNNYFRDCADFPFRVSFNDVVPGVPLVHFVGPENKKDRIERVLKTYSPVYKMSECMYPLENKKPCQKPAVSQNETYGPLCKRHAREQEAAATVPIQTSERKVMIGTLSYNGTVDVRYVDALFSTCRMFPNIRFVPIFMSFDSLIQRARNDTIDLALKTGMDDLIFIDADIEWDPAWIGKLLEYPVDVVGGTYRKKTDEGELYVVKLTTHPPPTDTRTGLMKVDGLGCGFIRLSRKAMQYLWNASEPYTEVSHNQEKRMIFEVIVNEEGHLLSEDINMCAKLRRGGFDVHLDPRMCCNHSGSKLFRGNFYEWYNKLLEELRAKKV